MKRLLFIPILLLLCPICFADITSDTGTYSKDETIVIGGSGFGTKSTAAPIKFEDFEDGVDGNAISSTSYWSTDGTAATFSDDNLRTTGLNAKQVLTGLHDLFYRTNIDFASTHKAYISFWVRYSRGTVASSEQIKLWRINGNAISGGIYPSIAWFETSNWQRYQLTKADSEGDAGNTDVFDGSPLAKDQWAFMEMELDFGTLNNSDGSIKIWIDGSNEHDESSLNFLTYASYTFKTVRFGEFAASTNSATEYFDDIYFDNVWSRVVIGNASTLESSTHREMQIPSAWATDEITFTCKPGSFVEDDNVFLFVVDSDGTVSSGYPIVIGSAGGGGEATDATISGNYSEGEVATISGNYKLGEVSTISGS